MYQRIISPRLLLSIGVGFLIFSLVFGWVAFSVPDWLQFYERNGIRNDTALDDVNFKDLKKIGLWYKCIFSLVSNDFTCTLWKNDAPSNVEKTLLFLLLCFFCFDRFRTSCTSACTIWVIIGLLITFDSLYCFYVPTNFC